MFVCKCMCVCVLAGRLLAWEVVQCARHQRAGAKIKHLVGGGICATWVGWCCCCCRSMDNICSTTCCDQGRHMSSQYEYICVCVCR